MTAAYLPREQAWSQLGQDQRVVVIGGGITGAGIFLQAARAGLRPLLVEAHDFASGTSSRSSKLVHGGLRYLRNGQFATTWHAVRERERLLQTSGGLVKRLPFIFPVYEGQMPLWMLGVGLTLFDLIALKWQHERLTCQAALSRCPSLRGQGLNGAYLYQDAQTDDARLVLRVIQEGIRAGGAAVNYAPVEELLLHSDGALRGLRIVDRGDPQCTAVELQAALVINATGAWADELRAQVDRPPRLRPLRGSHLVFPRDRLPLDLAVTMLHPHDQRPLFGIPWEGVTIFGTTDVDLEGPVTTDLGMADSEREYLFAALEHGFPGLALEPDDAISSFAGVRSVVSSGKNDPSKESREHAIWNESGLLTITGGKLTTFRLMAKEALARGSIRLPASGPASPDKALFEPPAGDKPAAGQLDEQGWQRFQARYGPLAADVARCAKEGEFERIAGLPTRWAELRWASRAEACARLEDIMLRRTRLGLQLPAGGQDLLPQIRGIVQPEMGWSDGRWDEEAQAYGRLWARHHSP